MKMEENGGKQAGMEERVEESGAFLKEYSIRCHGNLKNNMWLSVAPPSRTTLPASPPAAAVPHPFTWSHFKLIYLFTFHI